METAAADSCSTHDDASETPDSRRLTEAIHKAAHLLPAQGPITVFIHHNTLHAFEDLPFHDAVKLGGQIFGCQPYLSEDRYREALRRGRIRYSDLQQVLEEDLGAQAHEAVPHLGTRLSLRLAMLEFPLRTGPTEELAWHVADAGALRHVRPEVAAPVRARMIAETRRWVMRDLRALGDRNGKGSRSAFQKHAAEHIAELLGRFDQSTIEGWTEEDWESFTLQAIWRLCCDGVRDLPSHTAPPTPPVRHRDLLLEATGADADAPVNELLVRFCAAFLDQGFSHWPLPRREEGFFRAFCALYRQRGGPPERWRRGLELELARIDDDRMTPLESIRESLELLGVAEEEWESYLSATFLALRGWAGMVHEVEVRGDRVAHPVPPGSLVGFLAVRLLLDRFSLAHVARTELGFTGNLGRLREAILGRAEPPRPPSTEQRAFLVFKLTQLYGLSADMLYHVEDADWATILQEIETFTGVERRRIFHLAYERRFRTQTLDAIALHAQKAAEGRSAPSFQVCCCIDEREESFRRHLEELAPSVETFGAAGFFSVAIYYRGAADAHFVPLCPVVIRPQHWIAEEVLDTAGEAHRRRARTRRALGTASHRFHVGSRTFATGALLTGAVGVLASVPLVARILFPRVTARIRRAFGRMVQTPQHTRLHLERSEETSGPDSGHLGYSVDEMAGVGERLLRDMGLTAGFSRLLILIGHGSNSQNNPHNSAYNCGACGGASGGPNARAMAQILNDPRVRAILAARGLTIPETTVIVGAYHNTCNDSVVYYDLDRLPASHEEEFESARLVLEVTCARNAHERCRRFMSAPLTLSFLGARQHVEERAEDLAQPRPELGHATNAITIVGRRSWSRGLFLDRRAFLTSYDPTQDDADCSILTRVLGAVFPVCAGINLEYYFSNVDNAGFGAGSKLPHNIAALLGVMDGAMSDLRTGLPWQMVEIHEPVRSLFVIETTPEAMLKIMDRNEPIGRLCRNGWILLSVIDPTTRRISVFDGGEFHPYDPQSGAVPQAPSSVDWYRGWREHLEFAEIVS